MGPRADLDVVAKIKKFLPCGVLHNTYVSIAYARVNSIPKYS